MQGFFVGRWPTTASHLLEALLIKGPTLSGGWQEDVMGRSKAEFFLRILPVTPPAQAGLLTVFRQAWLRCGLALGGGGHRFCAL